MKQNVSCGYILASRRRIVDVNLKMKGTQSSQIITFPLRAFAWSIYTYILFKKDLHLFFCKDVFLCFNRESGEKQNDEFLNLRTIFKDRLP